MDSGEGLRIQDEGGDMSFASDFQVIAAAERGRAALKLVLALQAHPEAQVPGTTGRLDPLAEEQLRAAVADLDAALGPDGVPPEDIRATERAA